MRHANCWVNHLPILFTTRIWGSVTSTTITLRLAKKQPAVSLIAVHIHAVTSYNLMQQGWAYRFYGREMVRVTTHFADDCGERANVVFHRHKYLNDFEAYIWKRLFHNTWYNAKQASQRILFQALGDLRVLDDEEETLLGWGDCVAHVCHLALNPDKRWKQTNTSCLRPIGELYLAGALAQ